MTFPRWRSLVIVLLLAAAPGFAAPKDEIISLKVTWNNPFNPAQGEETRFEYRVYGKDAAVKLAVYTVDGRMVRLLADHVAQSDILYVQPWDGRNDRGTLVDSGLYFISLDAGHRQRKVQRVAVRKE